MTNSYIDDAQAVKILKTMLDGKALRPPKFGERKHISAKLSQVAIDGLANIAKQLGYVHGGRGNISLLLEAIGTGTVRVQPTPLQPRHLE